MCRMKYYQGDVSGARSQELEIAFSGRRGFVCAIGLQEVTDARRGCRRLLKLTSIEMKRECVVSMKESSTRWCGYEEG